MVSDKVFIYHVPIWHESQSRCNRQYHTYETYQNNTTTSIISTDCAFNVTLISPLIYLRFKLSININCIYCLYSITTKCLNGGSIPATISAILSRLALAVVLSSVRFKTGFHIFAQSKNQSYNGERKTLFHFYRKFHIDIHISMVELAIYFDMQ